MEGIVFLTFTIHSRQKSRWWQLKYIFIFIPTWRDDPIWRSYFSKGLVQPPTRKSINSSPRAKAILGHPGGLWVLRGTCRRLCFFGSVFVTHRLRKSFWGPHHEGNTYEISDVWSHVPQQKHPRRKTLVKSTVSWVKSTLTLVKTHAKWAVIKEFLVGCFKSGDEKPPSNIGDYNDHNQPL